MTYSMEHFRIRRTAALVIAFVMTLLVLFVYLVTPSLRTEDLSMMAQEPQQPTTELVEITGD